MFWRGSRREEVICSGVTITMQFQVLIPFCGFLGIWLSPAGCHRRITLAALEASPSWNEQPSSTTLQKFTDM